MKRKYRHNPKHRYDTAHQRQGPGNLNHGFLVIPAVSHDIGNRGGGAGRHICGKAGRLNQNHQPDRIASRGSASSDGNGMVNQHGSPVGHKLGLDERNDEENQSHNIRIAVHRVHQPSDMAADQFSGACGT